jgi:hypothetical protein
VVFSWIGFPSKKFWCNVFSVFCFDFCMYFWLSNHF